MTRTVKEWVGKTPDTPAPPRVRVRVFIRDNGTCQCGCKRKITVGDKWQTDHIVAIINGGGNRESNLQTILAGCHKAKTARDVAVKAKTARMRNRHLGIKKRTSRPMPGSKASGWKRKVNGQVERRS